MSRKNTKYHITLLPNKDGDIIHVFTSRMHKVKKVIEKNKDIVLGCWKEVNTKNKSKTTRIFRK